MFLKKIIRLVFSIALLFFLFSLLNVELLIEVIKSVDKLVYSIAILVCVLANLLCSFRWGSFSIANQMAVPRKFFVLFYFESIAANCILPGGILGGDMWRTARIIKEHKKNSISHDSIGENTKNKLLKLSVSSVFIDRIHGFWSLCFIGLICYLLIFFSTFENSIEISQLKKDSSIEKNFYLIILLSVSSLPLFINYIYLFFGKYISNNFFYKQYFNFEIKNLWLESKRIKTVLISLTSQVFFGVVFWICMFCIGININIFFVLLVVPGIFLFASLPIAIAGFGPREAGSLIFLMPIGINAEQIFISSVLFGLTSTIIGGFTLLLNLFLQSKNR